MCGEAIGPFSLNFETSRSWRYDGICTDLFFQVLNSGAGATGLLLAVREVGGAWIPNAFNSGDGVTAITQYNPPFGFMTDPTYDYSNWVPPVEQTSTFPSEQAYLDFRTQYGSAFWTTADGVHANGDPNAAIFDAWYRVSLPFC